MPPRILITGSRGLVGNRLSFVLRSAGFDVAELDLRGRGVGRGDVRDPRDIRRASGGCVGIVHLAAVSRVICGEREPERCWSTNVGGTSVVVEQALAYRERPWVIFASSREVYGQATLLPVREPTSWSPVNVYGRSKVEAEQILISARRQGLRAATLRLSNVYGSIADHADRVVPAFARAAVLGAPLSVQGSDHTFDFTHIDDTARGIAQLVDRLERGGPAPPPIHLLTGKGTTLGELARLAVELAGTNAVIREDAPRSFDVSLFYGDPSRARAELDWSAQVAIRAGLRRLVLDFQRDLCGTGPEVNSS